MFHNFKRKEEKLTNVEKSYRTQHLVFFKIQRYVMKMNMLSIRMLSIPFKFHTGQKHFRLVFG